MSYIYIIITLILLVLTIAVSHVYAIINTPIYDEKDMDIVTKLILKKEDKIENSPATLTIKQYIIGLAIGPLVSLGLSLVFIGSGLYTIFFMILGLFIPEAILAIQEAEERAKFEERYAQSLELLGSSLRAGRNLTQSIEDVINSVFITDSLKKMYQILLKEIMLGIPVGEAFHHFADHTKSNDARDVAIAIDVQNTVGAREADVVISICNNIHKRIQTRNEVKSSLTSTTIMVRAFDFIPFAVTGYYFFMVDNDSFQVYMNSPMLMLVFFGIMLCFLVGIIINHHMLRKIMKEA